VRPDKTRVLRRSRQQDVTGVVVNSKPNVSRRELKRFRATLYQIEKDGPVGKSWGRSPDVIASLQGYANFVYMVNPGKGAELQRRVRAVAEKYGWEPAKVEPRLPSKKPGPPAGTTSPEPQSTQPAPAQKKWWKLW
jgi:hypothetical protein